MMSVLLALFWKPVQEDVLKSFGKDFYAAFKRPGIDLNGCKTPEDAHAKIKKDILIWEKLFFGRNIDPPKKGQKK